MSLEKNISEVIQKQLQGDIIERVVAEQLEKCVSNAVNELFKSWGACTKIIEEKLKSVMVPQLEAYDYSQHIIKLDTVLTEILKNTTIDNKKLLKNFKEFITEDDTPKVVKMSEIFNKYKKYVANNVDTDGLDIDYDDGVCYSPVETMLEVEEEQGRDWSSFKYGKIFLECRKNDEDQDSLNVEIGISRWKEDKEDVWSLHIDKQLDLTSLRYIDDFSIYLIKLMQAGTKIEMDTYEDSDDVTPNKEPEPTYE